MALKPDAALRKDLTTAITTSLGDLQHRHFATIAAILRDLNAPTETCEQWADRLRHTNPRFDRARFLRACAAN